MKKRMRYTAILASAAMLCGTVPAMHASALYVWGTAGNDAFSEMQQVDDKGLFSGIPTGEGIGTADNYQVLTSHYSYDREFEVTDADTGETKTELHHIEGDRLYVVCPRENVLRFVLRADLDEAEAKQQAETILRKYYPDMVADANGAGIPVSFGQGSYVNSYEIRDRTDTAGSAELSDAIMKELAQAGLISAFYTWGQTANFQEVWYQYPTAYSPTGHKWDSEYKELELIPYDWDAIEAWVETHHPECEFVHLTAEDTELAKQIGYYDYAQNKAYIDEQDGMYAVIPPDGTAFPEHFEIAAELYAEFGIAQDYLCPESINPPRNGLNALAVAGDLNLDCAVNVKDAVLLARLAGNGEDVAITDQGMANADVDGAEGVSVDDLTKLLQAIANLIQLS